MSPPASRGMGARAPGRSRRGCGPSMRPPSSRRVADWCRCRRRAALARHFSAGAIRQPIGELLLTPRALDRPFFSELNARPMLPGTLSAVPNRFGEWGEIYAGLLTGNLPRELPLGTPQKLAENLFVLLNPALPPLRGK